jgi:PqqD family protein of HPr-rel-A system
VAAPIFAADPEAALAAVALDGLSVLFHTPSGMTHIVAPPAPQILEALRGAPVDAAGLLARLRQLYEFGGEDAAVAIAARLDELEQAGLVRRI